MAGHVTSRSTAHRVPRGRMCRTQGCPRGLIEDVGDFVELDQVAEIGRRLVGIVFSAHRLEAQEGSTIVLSALRGKVVWWRLCCSGVLFSNQEKQEV
mmetsp:Transcript_37901/g.99272  ORF Transcript_37901/g.99272 Transcript_37901/m.99272 type:complete len:97 (-) Transcript_37901:168-458(-)